MTPVETYQRKFELLSPWGEEIVAAVRKELKSDHLPKHPQMVQKHFSKRALQKISAEEMVGAYLSEVAGGNEEVSAWVASRWVIKHAEIYHFFAAKLAEINPKFDEIERIPDDRARAFMEQASLQFGPKRTYIFSVLNAVVFPEAIMQELRTRAEEDSDDVAREEAAADESVEAVKERYEREIVKLTDKYEKRLLGFHKKYTQDTDGLKKQIAQLQRQLHAKC
jgi:hypothetical protein